MIGKESMVAPRGIRHSLILEYYSYLFINASKGLKEGSRLKTSFGNDLRERIMGALTFGVGRIVGSNKEHRCEESQPRCLGEHCHVLERRWGPCSPARELLSQPSPTNPPCPPRTVRSQLYRRRFQWPKSILKALAMIYKICIIIV